MNRREALTSLSLAAGATMLGKSCSSPEKESIAEVSEFYYSLNTSTISGKSPGIENYISLAAEAGYDFIEVWVRDVAAYLEAGNSTASLKNLVDSQGLKIASAIGFAPWMTGGEEGFAQMRKEMEMLAEIGCPRIAAPPAGVDAAKPLDLFMVGEKYAALLEMGRQTGCMPQLEFWGASHSLWHIGQVLMIAAVAGDPDTRILPDVYHLFRGGSDFDALGMLDGHMIDLFHMNDYPGNIPRLEQTDADRVYPGDGTAPLGKILGYLKKMGAPKILSLELFNRSYWEQDPKNVAATGLSKMKAAMASMPSLS